MTTSAKPRRARGAAVSWAVAVSLVVGCSGGDDSASVSTTEATHTATNPTTTEPTTSTTTTTVPGPEGEVLAAVDGYWQSFLDANDPPDPDHPGLARYRTGEALRVAVDNVRERQQLGHYVRLPNNSVFSRQTELVEVGQDLAEVRDCVIDDSELVEQGSEAVLNSEVETTQYLMTLKLEGDQWKVADVLLEQQWEGQSECHS